jgi:hypothetical protein
MPRRRRLYPHGMPEENALPELLTDHEWEAVRSYLMDPAATMVQVAKKYGLTRYRVEQIVAIVNVEYSRHPALGGRGAVEVEDE